MRNLLCSMGIGYAWFYQNIGDKYSEVTASSSFNAERPTQARHIARPHRRIKGATQHPERKESTRQQQENKRSTEPFKHDRRSGQSATRSNLNQNSDNTDDTIVTPSSHSQHQSEQQLTKE
ncbi:hypothetical protein ElyMa_001028300 [Elysia marginata]|uniref:Uncharacterized protein n=1 Tax=Elysia marginata TaxID=1093978 RepID=A0AAV4HLM0_9GAST|nr:hypothetical protein ElyMa_001028300 [Elysia marginata]